MRKVLLAATAAALTVPALPTAAFAHDRYAASYNDRGYYQGPTWRGRDGRTYCRRSDGTTGLIVGGAAGALIGRAIDTQGERTTGTILGAAAGALLGREVQRSRARCR
ncbi:MAG: glycine zipper 2TM domain-containing protein [Allosphingosinicella sp.]|uniref:glycine zipper 2TM domain-containing protein n=1 Tax=Allosphingosinicella sp. TaxID=2823234 RepID=UPI00394A4874